LEKNKGTYSLETINSSSVITLILDMFIQDYNAKILLGRPIVNIITDNPNGLITGISITVGEPLWIGIREALYNCAENKVKLCSQYNIKITENEWPSLNIPSYILLDEVDLTNSEIKGLTKELNISIDREGHRYSNYEHSKKEKKAFKFNECVDEALSADGQNILNINEFKVASLRTLTKATYKAVIIYNKNHTINL
jgi:hypothetical protein